MITLNYETILFIIWCLLMGINITINICVFIALRRTSNKSISAGLEKGVETISKLLGSVNVDGVKDVIGLIKDITSNPDDKTTGDNHDSK